MGQKLLTVAVERTYTGNRYACKKEAPSSLCVCIFKCHLEILHPVSKYLCSSPCSSSHLSASALPGTREIMTHTWFLAIYLGDWVCFTFLVSTWQVVVNVWHMYQQMADTHLCLSVCHTLPYKSKTFHIICHQRIQVKTPRGTSISMIKVQTCRLQILVRIQSNRNSHSFLVGM